MIVKTLARMLIKEHLYKPITGKILTLGRQTISISYNELMDLFHEENYEPPIGVLDTLKVELDTTTRVGKGHEEWVSDKVFFQLLGINEFDVLDVSEYEKCNIAHDLNNPVPAHLYGKYDFIIDGGTFDHLFDLRMCFENVVKMLKPKGRVFQWNAASNFTGAAYLSFGPDLFYDYYVLNNFADCKVYIVELDTVSQNDNWDIYEFMGSAYYSHFISERIQMVVLLAEKGEITSYDNYPIQSQYRDANLNSLYENVINNIQKSTRNSLLESKDLSLPKYSYAYKNRYRDKKLIEKFKVFVRAKLLHRPFKLPGYRYIGRI